MSAGDLNYSSAISEGNTLSRSVGEHNESIRQNNQLLVQAWNQQKNTDAKKSVGPASPPPQGRPCFPQGWF